MADVIGRAVIEVAPDVSRFGQKLSRDLRQVTSTFKKISVGVSAGSVRKAFVEVSRLNLALRAATIGFAALAAKSIAGGFLTAADAVAQLSGALAVLPAVGAAAAVAVGTLAVGLFGVDDALKAFLKGDMEKFNEKLSELSPNARQAVGVLKEFKPVLDQFRDAVQDALFANLAPSLRELGTKLLPLVKQGFVGVATEFNLLARNLVKFATSKQSLADVATIFGKIREFFHGLVPAGTAFAGALRDIVAVGAQFLPGLAAVITAVAEAFAKFVADARATGKLSDFIGRGLSSLGQLVGIFVDLGKAVAGVLRAARDSGIGFLDIVGKLASQLSRAINSVQGQEALGKFFDNVKIAVEALLPILGALGSFFNNEFFPIVTQIAVILGPSLVVLIDGIGQAFDAARPGIEAFASGVGKFLEGIAPALPIIGELIGVIGRGLGTVLERIAPVLERFIVAIADTLAKALADPDLIDGLVALIDGMGDLAIAMIPLIPILIKIAVLFLPVAARLLQALVPIIHTLEPVLKVLAALLEPIAIALERIIALLDRLSGGGGAGGGNIFANIFAPATVAFGLFNSALDDVIHNTDNTAKRFSKDFDDSGKSINEFISSSTFNLAERLPDEALGPAGRHIIDFKDIVDRLFGETVGIVEHDMNRIVQIIFGTGEPLGAAGSALGVKFTSGLSGALGIAVEAARAMMGEIGSVLNNSDFSAAGAAVTRSFASGMRSLLESVRAASNAVAGAAGSALPRSPAEEGPFSGRGWTPFRGRSLTEGFAEGIISGLDVVRGASRRLAEVTASGLTEVSSTPSTRGGTGPTVIVRPSEPTSTTSGSVNVQVFIDGRELRGVVVQVADERDRALRRSVQSGVGGSR